jgi:hypothetical protein
LGLPDIAYGFFSNFILYFLVFFRVISRMPPKKRRDTGGPSRGRGSPPPKKSDRGQFFNLYFDWDIDKEPSLGHQVLRFAAKVRSWCNINPGEHLFPSGRKIGGKYAIYLDAFAFREQSQADFFARLQDTLIRISGGDEKKQKVLLCASIANGIRRQILELAANFNSDFAAFESLPEIRVLKKIHASCFRGLVEGPIARKHKSNKYDKDSPNYFTYIMRRTDLWINDFHDLCRSADIPTPIVVPIQGVYLLSGDDWRLEFGG